VRQIREAKNSWFLWCVLRWIAWHSRVSEPISPARRRWRPRVHVGCQGYTTGVVGSDEQELRMYGLAGWLLGFYLSVCSSVLCCGWREGRWLCVYREREVGRLAGKLRVDSTRLDLSVAAAARRTDARSLFRYKCQSERTDA